MKLRFCGKVIRFWLMAVVLITLCTVSKTVHAADAKRTIWQSREQFVAVERQDSVSGAPVAANDHPVELSQDKLTGILSSLSVRSAENEKPVSLFTAAAVEVLVPQLQKGLLQASPGEDVTFAVIGLHDALYGLAKSPRVTTGRVFYRAGKLNLIVGLVQKDVNDREDRRLSPFTPGSRQKKLGGDWTLLPHSGQNGFTLARKDWAVFSDEWHPAVIPVPAAEIKPPPAPAPAVQSVDRTSETRSPIERLTTLKELKDKGLISEEEYRGKRLQILDGL